MDKQTLLGTFFGFPQCCVKEFTNNPIPYWERLEIVQLTMRNGFVPCPECAAKVLTKKITLENLIQNRLCSIPFKVEENTHEEDRLMQKEIDEFLKKD